MHRVNNFKNFFSKFFWTLFYLTFYLNYTSSSTSKGAKTSRLVQIKLEYHFKKQQPQPGAKQIKSKLNKQVSCSKYPQSTYHYRIPTNIK